MVADLFLLKRLTLRASIFQFKELTIVHDKKVPNFTQSDRGLYTKNRIKFLEQLEPQWQTFSDTIKSVAKTHLSYTAL